LSAVSIVVPAKRPSSRARPATTTSGIPAAAAVGRPINQHEDSTAESGEGRLLTGGGWLRRKLTFVSGGGTADEIARAIAKLSATADPGRRQLLEDLQFALAAFTAVEYARDPVLNRATLDEALTRALAAARRLKAQRSWPQSYIRRWTVRGEAPQQA
jgi:hypothetical protein